MEIVERNMSKADMRGTAILPGSKLDFGQFSGLANGHFLGISDASANFLTVLGAPGTDQISPCTPYSRAFRAFARSKIGQSQAKQVAVGHLNTISSELAGRCP